MSLITDDDYLNLFRRPKPGLLTVNDRSLIFLALILIPRVWKGLTRFKTIGSSERLCEIARFRNCDCSSLAQPWVMEGQHAVIGRFNGSKCRELSVKRTMIWPLEYRVVVIDSLCGWFFCRVRYIFKLKSF